MTEPTRNEPEAEICVVFGALRSGTTLFRLMLEGHPRIAAPGESDFLVDHLRPDGRGGAHYDLDGLAADRIFRAAGIALPTTTGARRAFAEMTTALRAGHEGPLVLILHRHLGRLLELLPNRAPVLHLVRDPRDVARSAIGIGLAGNSYYGVRSWIDTERDWDATAPSLGGRPVKELHYERLLERPEATLREAAALFGVDYDARFLSYPERSTYDLPDTALTAQWRNKLSAREVGLIESRVGPLLEARGYAPSGAPRVAPGLATRSLLWLDHTRGKWRWRFRRFGVTDPLIAAIGRRPGMGWIARGANARIERRITETLK
ncbi:sulfotransferase family protein [Roseovarius salinarum]|uniref:sulfotransferase family protein n=1 Tax=Roseovarius salinarum TaxID=1981892 RepID=UPI000C326101|nr:sulfotransferase [Roseovarius salinarum]